MKKIFASIALLLVGVVCGWILHSTRATPPPRSSDKNPHGLIHATLVQIDNDNVDSAREILDVALAYSVFELREHYEEASEEAKKELLPKIDKYVDFMLDRPGRFSELGSDSVDSLDPELRQAAKEWKADFNELYKWIGVETGRPVGYRQRQAEQAVPPKSDRAGG